MTRPGAILAAAVLAVGGCALVDGFSDTPPDGGPDAGDLPSDAGELRVDAGAGEPDAGSLPEWLESGWHRPVLFAHGHAGEAHGVRVAMDSGGRAYAAYSVSGSDGSNAASSVWLATKGEDEAAWVEAGLPHAGGGVYEAEPQVAAGKPGGAVVVFAATATGTFPAQHLYAARFDVELQLAPGGPARLDTTQKSPQLADRQAVAVDENGFAAVVWASDDGYVLSRSLAGNQWDPPSLFTHDGPYTRPEARVALLSGWAMFSYAHFAERVAMLANLAQTPVKLLESTRFSTTAGAAPIASYGSGRPMLVWVEGENVVLQRYVTPAELPKVVVTPRISSDPPAVAVNGAGRAVAAWRRMPDGQHDVALAEIWAAFFDGSFWGEAQRISIPGDHRKATGVDVAISDQGRGIATWVDLDEGGTFARVWASTMTWSGSEAVWSVPFPIDVPDPRSKSAANPAGWGAPSVVMDAGGSNLVVVWTAVDADGHGQAWSTWRR